MMMYQHAKDTEIVEDRRILALIPEATHRYHALQQKNIIHCVNAYTAAKHISYNIVKSTFSYTYHIVTDGCCVTAASAICPSCLHYVT